MLPRLAVIMDNVCQSLPDVLGRHMIMFRLRAAGDYQETPVPQEVIPARGRHILQLLLQPVAQLKLIKWPLDFFVPVSTH